MNFQLIDSSIEGDTKSIKEGIYDCLKIDKTPVHVILNDLEMLGEFAIIPEIFKGLGATNRLSKQESVTTIDNVVFRCYNVHFFLRSQVLDGVTVLILLPTPENFKKCYDLLKDYQNANMIVVADPDKLEL